MRAARAAGYNGPIANLSFPDVTGPILRRLGLAPTVGLGNAGMVLLRVRAALRSGAPDAELPLVRVLGQHSQVYGVMQAREPVSPDERCRVYVGRRGDEMTASPIARRRWCPGVGYNPVTAAATLPVLEAPAARSGAAALVDSGARWAPGGYPVRIANGSVTLDLAARGHAGSGGRVQRSGWAGRTAWSASMTTARFTSPRHVVKPSPLSLPISQSPSRSTICRRGQRGSTKYWRRSDRGRYILRWRRSDAADDADASLRDAIELGDHGASPSCSGRTRLRWRHWCGRHGGAAVAAAQLREARRAVRPHP